jgi:predicted metalloprotease
MSDAEHHPEVGIVSVCAHEFGHIAQFKHKLEDELIVMRLVDGERQPFVKRLELHADFMAGYFAGRRKLESPDFPAAVFATTQYNEGDNAYGDPHHHGTSAERGQAVVAGFDTGFRAQQSFEQALETGLRYVQQIRL